MANGLDQPKVTEVVKLIDKDGNGTIAFEEYMAFVDLYIAYFDEKGSRIKKMDELI